MFNGIEGEAILLHKGLGCYGCRLGQLLQKIDVCPGAKGSIAGSRQDDSTDLGIAFELAKESRHLAEHLGALGIEDRGTIQRHIADPPLGLEEYGLVWHVVPPLTPAEGW